MFKRLTPAGIVLLYAAFAALWIVATGYLLTLSVADPILQGRIELAKDLLFIAVTSGLLYLLLKGWRDASGDAAEVTAANKLHPPKTSQLLLLFAAFALVVPLLGLVVNKLYGPQIERDAYANLQAIVQLKASQLEQWLDERNGDAMALLASGDFAKQIGQFIHNQHNADLSKSVLQRFANLRAKYSYGSILLFDNNGKLLLILGEEADNTPALQQRLRRALSSQQVQRGDLSLDETGHVHLDWVVPIFSPAAQDASPAGLGAVVLRVTAEDYIFPLIQTWPSASASAETLLVQSEGQSALYLNELRHRKGAALTLKLPLSDAQLPAAIAIREAKPGTTQGKDYRDAEVLAAYRPIAGTNWHIVAKIDRAEVLAPLRIMNFLFSVVVFLSLAVVGAVVLLLWRQQQRTHLLELRAESSAVIEESEQRFRAIAQSASAAIISADSAGNIVNWNASAERLFGYSEAQIIGQPLTLLIPERFHNEGLARIVAGAKTNMTGKIMQRTGLRKDGSEFPLECSMSSWETSGGLFVTAIIRDIIERKRTEEALRDSHEKLDRLINSMVEGVYEVNTLGNCTFVNQAFLQMLGYQNQNEVLGKHIHELIHHSHADGSPYPATECKMYCAYQTDQSINQCCR